MSHAFERLAREEEDENIKKLADEKSVAMLAIIAPHVPYRISPRRVVYVELGTPEEFGIETFILKAKERGIRKLYLLLHSPGGGVSSAYVIAKALRKNFDDITVFIPQLAASGATLIAIAANRIVMGEISRVSPIDVLIWEDEGMKSALSLVKSFARLESRFERTPLEDISYPYRHLIESIKPEELERMHGVLTEVESYAHELLKMANYEENKAKEIAETLVYGFHIHFEVVSYERLREMGLNVVWYEDRREEWGVMRYWLGKYILEENPIHHIVYVFPSEGGISNEAGEGD